jgi:polyphosphate kinase 2 (PPK2 family)
MHISDDEQLTRFQERQQDPLKRWKLTDEDWRNRTKNREYDVAAEDLFPLTDHALAPWNLVPAEQKRFGRIHVLEELNRRIEEGMLRWGSPVPDPMP